MDYAGFIGAFNDPRLGPILVMEKMQENLRQFLDKWKKKLQLPKQLRISLEIIRGVAFLHQQTPPLVHRDLNDKNVMFSFEGVVKIGDFGQSKLKKDLYLTTGQPGMVTFMPPEALAVGKLKYNESLDIFSIGVLMLEIGTQQEPLVNLHGIGTLCEVERREVDLKALGEDHPLRQPALLCLKDNPKERPKASDLQRDVLAMIDEGDEVYTMITSCFLYTSVLHVSIKWTFFCNINTIIHHVYYCTVCLPAHAISINIYHYFSLSQSQMNVGQSYRESSWELVSPYLTDSGSASFIWTAHHFYCLFPI